MGSTGCEQLAQSRYAAASCPGVEHMHELLITSPTCWIRDCVVCQRIRAFISPLHDLNVHMYRQLNRRHTVAVH